MAFDFSKVRKIVHTPTWKMLSPMPAASAAGSFVRSLQIPALNIDFATIAVNTGANIYAYDAGADCASLLPTSGIAGAFAAGACGRIHPMGESGTATAGSTTTLTTALTITRDLRGYYIRITGGPGAGDVRRIASNTKVSGASVITVTTAFSATITTSSTYVLLVPRLWVFNPGTSSVGFSVYSYTTNTWTSRSVTNLPTSFGTDGALCQTPAMVGNQLDSHDNKGFGSCTTTVLTLTAGRGGPNWTTNQWTNGILTVTGGTGVGQVRTVASNTNLTLTFDVALTTALDATSTWILELPFESSRGKTNGTHTTTTIVTTAGATWTTNSWANSQVRIVAGTGAGQTRNIASNTAAVLTVSTAFTTTPDATSVWVIEGNDDNLYLLGNAAVTMYKYSISGNTWATAAATSARAASPGAGLGATWVYGVRDTYWNNPSAIRNGRYILSFRGGGSNALDVYDLALTTWANVFGVNGAQAYGASGETFNTGCCYEYDDRDNIYIATARSAFLRFDLIKNAIFPVAQYTYPQGTAVAGDKLFLYPVMSDGVRLDALYHWRNSDVVLHRCLMWNTYNG